jgi:hypothetical protein
MGAERGTGLSKKQEECPIGKEIIMVGQEDKRK